MVASRSARWEEWALRSLLGGIAAMLVWVMLQIVSIQSNRFTAKDGQVVWQEIATIREKMASLPQEVPPQWVRDTIARNRDGISDISRSVVGLESKLQSLEGQVQSLDAFIRARMGVRNRNGWPLEEPQQADDDPEPEC